MLIQQTRKSCSPVTLKRLRCCQMFLENCLSVFRLSFRPGACPARFCIFTVFGNEWVVAPRVSRSCTQKRTTSAGTSVIRLATLAAQVSGETFFSQKKKHDNIPTCLHPILDGRKRQNAALISGIVNLNLRRQLFGVDQLLS